MTNSNSDQSLMDKSMRSVFVGNIPYEATEENLKDIFSEVGPVLSFKLVYDRETGKPKGYGFCEYKDQETALSAMRNLNSYEIGGRTLRVDNACTEKSRMEMQSLLQTHNTENAYGEAVQSDKAPEAISKAVAALPPEQMFELMKQMKLCIQNNPTEARQLLLQNPQLSYALLQAHVVMRIVDPQTAVSMLHKANPIPAVLTPSEHPPIPTFQPRIEEPWATPRTAPVVNPPPPIFAGKDVDLRTLERPIDHRLGRMDMDLRTATQPPPIAVVPPVVPPMMDTRSPVFNSPDNSFSRDPRADRFGRDPRDARDPRLTVDTRMNKSTPPTLATSPQGPRPVVAPAVPPVNINSVSSTTSSPGFSASSAAASRLMAGMSPAGNIPSGASDQEKAALIMQVLQLTDDQIAKLPIEQRQSILVLKEQIANSTPR